MENQPKENIIGATVETIEKVKVVAKDTTEKVTTCAKDCASTVQSKAKEVSGAVKKKSDSIARKGRGFAYKALTGLCGARWLQASEHAIVGALDKITGDRSGPVDEQSTAAREETVI